MRGLAAIGKPLMLFFVCSCIAREKAPSYLLGSLRSKRSKAGVSLGGWKGGHVSSDLLVGLGETVMDARRVSHCRRRCLFGCTHLSVRSGLTDRVIGCDLEDKCTQQLIIIVREDIFFL